VDRKNDDTTDEPTFARLAASLGSAALGGCEATVRSAWEVEDEGREVGRTGDGLVFVGAAEWWRAVLDGAGGVWEWCSECVVRWAVA
jgi:hypothetical protein